MDVLVLIDKLDELVHNAKAVPLTDQVRIDREEIWEILDQMRATIPDEIKQARWIVKERQEMLGEAKRESERIVVEAREIAQREASQQEVVRLAERQAQEILENARNREREIRLGAEDYADEILGTLEAKGIKGLSWGVWDFRGFLMNGTDINQPANMKGKKIRVIENALYVRTVQAFGGNPVPMAWPEVYTALQQRTIDGVDTNYHGMADSKLFEVAKSLAITDHIFTATVYVMNLKKFQSLSPAHQEVVLKASRAAGETMRAGAAKANEDAIALMEKNGVKLIRPERPPFENAVAGVHKFFSTMVGADLLKEVADAQR